MTVELGGAFGLRPGDLVVLNDGPSCPFGALAALSDEAERIGGVRLLLGWSPLPLAGLRVEAFAHIAATLGGYSLRGMIDRGQADYMPVRLSLLPTWFRSSLRPSVVVASIAQTADGLRFTTDVGYLRAAVMAGARVAGFTRPNAVTLDRGPALPPEATHVVGIDQSPIPPVEWAPPDFTQRRIGEHVAALIPEGARVQFGPGPLGAATLEALQHPVFVDTGIVTEAVMDLDRRGLLLGRPIAPYVAGTTEMYEWARDRVDGVGVDVTHVAGRLASDPGLIAVNTALEIDLDGQVNVEAVGGSTLAGVGGHPDYALGAATNPRGCSIIAVPTKRGRHSTLVERLGAPTSTTSTDVDVIVTEHGSCDLRGLSRGQRRAAISSLWP